MAQATQINTTSRFNNLSDAALADALGYADATLKGAETECKALKDEFKHRSLSVVAGGNFTVTATEQIAGRLDTKAVKTSWATTTAALKSRSFRPSSGSRQRSLLPSRRRQST